MDQLTKDSGSPSLHWKLECKLEPLPCEPERKNEIHLKLFNLSPLKQYKTDGKRPGSSASPNFACTVCNTTFSKYYALSRHISVRHGSKQQPIECGECGKRFSRKDNLKRHLSTHSKQYKTDGKRPDSSASSSFTCTVCSTTFSMYNALARHKRVRHGNKQPVECGECGKRFSRKDNLKQHLALHSKPSNSDDIASRKQALNCDVTENCTIKKYSCVHCGKSFVWEKKLQPHLLYFCPVLRDGTQCTSSWRHQSSHEESPACTSSSPAASDPSFDEVDTAFGCRLQTSRLKKDLTKCEDKNNINSKEENHGNPSGLHQETNSHYDSNTEGKNAQFDAAKDVLKELVTENRSNSDLEDIGDQKSFNLNEPVKQERLEREIIVEKDSHHQQYSYTKIPVRKLEDNETKLEHFPLDNKKDNEESSAAVINGCLNNFSQPLEGSIVTHSENKSSSQSNNSHTGLSLSQGLNVIAATDIPCRKCHEVKCNCHINVIQNRKSSDIDSDCKCYKCRRQSYKRRRAVFKCDKCEKTYCDKKNLKTHKETNCNFLKPFNCNICMKGFSCTAGLKHHNYAFHFIEAGTHKCSACEKHFANQFLLHKHENKCKISSWSSENTERLLICEFCQKTYRTKNDLRNHCKRLHSPEKNFICTHCKERFCNKTYLSLHIQSRHSTETFRCEICHSSYKTMVSLKLHTAKHNTEKKYVCEICGKGFMTKERLERHITVHSSEKPWVCELCGKCFRVFSNLQQHSVTHSDKRPFACDLCGSAFRIRNHLRQHMAVHGMVNTSTKRNKKQK